MRNRSILGRITQRWPIRHRCSRRWPIRHLCSLRWPARHLCSLSRPTDALHKKFSPLRRGRLATFIFFALLQSGCSLIEAYQSARGPSDEIFLQGRLAPCDERPNCVSTQSLTAEHKIVPFTYSKPAAEAALALKAELLKQADARLIKEEGNYLHFEFRAGVMRTIDDVEFYFDEPTKTVQFRSSSRFGYSDWGGNRRRMENIRNVILGHI